MSSTINEKRFNLSAVVNGISCPVTHVSYMMGAAGSTAFLTQDLTAEWSDGDTDVPFLQAVRLVPALVSGSSLLLDGSSLVVRKDSVETEFGTAGYWFGELLPDTPVTFNIGVRFSPAFQAAGGVCTVQFSFQGGVAPVCYGAKEVLPAFFGGSREYFDMYPCKVTADIVAEPATSTTSGIRWSLRQGGAL